MIKHILLIFIGFSFLLSGNAQTSFSRGVNLSGWFQTSNAHQVQFTKYSKKDFENIKSLGCDVIRLPINLFYMTNGAPDYTIDPLFFEFMDQAVTWAEDLQIYLLLDNHSTDDIASKNPNLENVLSKVWTQMATHYKDRSNYILYEIMNEPNGITTSAWGSIQQKAINAIRTMDTKHTIVVGASGFNTYNELSLLPVYTDNNLIYTFHFYDPFLFTHQGASWVTPSMVPLSGIPFPYNAANMPALPASLKGSWIESSYNNYSNDGTLTKVKQLIDIAVAFKNNRKVKLYCGEFGVYNVNSSNADRVYWYGEVRKYLEQNGISWTSWDYQNGFGLFKKGTNELFESDINTDLVNALGLTVPAQKPFSIKADSTGSGIYSDYVGEKISESSYGKNSIVDYYNTGKPNYGKYCLYWTGTDQYGAINFHFLPDKDLSKLVNQNYALTFCIRGNSPGTKIEARFTDTKTNDVNDHPWRMNFTIDETIAAWDNKWHKVYIPLRNFVDQGSWDNGTWYNSTGSFDWKAVDKFEFVSDQGSLNGKAFWFDNVYIANMDTMRINETGSYVLGIKNLRTGNTPLKIVPNPATEQAIIYVNTEKAGNITIDIFNLSNQKVRSLSNQALTSGRTSVIWDLCDARHAKVPDGLYLCRISSPDGIESGKIMVVSR